MQRPIDIEKQKMKRFFNKYNLSLREVLSNQFSRKISRITYLGNCKIDAIPEYKYVILKFNIVLDNYSNYTVFIKIINAYNIEESLFCYWLFCEKNYNLRTQYYTPKANIVNYKQNCTDQKFEMQLFGKDNKIWKTSIISVTNLNNYIKDKFLFIAIL